VIRGYSTDYAAFESPRQNAERGPKLGVAALFNRRSQTSLAIAVIANVWPASFRSEGNNDEVNATPPNRVASLRDIFHHRRPRDAQPVFASAYSAASPRMCGWVQGSCSCLMIPKDLSRCSPNVLDDLGRVQDGEPLPEPEQLRNHFLTKALLDCDRDLVAGRPMLPRL